MQKNLRLDADSIDITYVRLEHGYVYLVMILDVGVPEELSI